MEQMLWALGALAVMLGAGSLVSAEDLLRVFPDGSGSGDQRVSTVKDTNTVWTFPHYETKARWEQAARRIREHILVSCGLQPMPEKCPLEPKIFGRIEHEDYTVEKVLLQTLPGFYLGGNLYRPRGKPGPFPAILNPHGHWGRGRLENVERGSVPGRCLSFARQGIVAFSYDMIGYNDTFQLPHNFDGDREALWGLSLMGLQLWNSIRAVDFVRALPEVDPRRLGCTGASGGGTQTFMLTAVDRRITAALPAVMVSAGMQGGCLCENAPCLRLWFSNVQIAALAAPRPLRLIACTKDWTRNTPEVEFPAIKRIYDLYGAGDRVSYFIQDYEHNYNLASREAAYQFFGQYLLGLPDPTVLHEQPFQVETDENLLALPDKKPLPGAKTRAQITAEYIAAARRQLGDPPRDRRALNSYRRKFGPVLRCALSAELPAADELVVQSLGKISRPDFTAERLVLGRKGLGDRVPALLFMPRDRKAPHEATVVVHAEGKAALMSEGLTEPGALIKALLKHGRAVLAVDVFLTGEFHPQAGRRLSRDTSSKHFTTYNKTDPAERVQDILTALAATSARSDIRGANLVGLGDAGLWCLLAAGVQPKALHKLAADAARFDLSDDAEFLARLNVPHLRRAGDLRTAVALFAPGPLLLHNAGGSFDLAGLKSIYRAAGASSALTAHSRRATNKQIADWIAGTG